MAGSLCSHCYAGDSGLCLPTQLEILVEVHVQWQVPTRGLQSVESWVFSSFALLLILASPGLRLAAAVCCVCASLLSHRPSLTVTLSLS